MRPVGPLNFFWLIEDQNFGKTADEEEDDGGDNNQPTVNPKSHLEDNYDYKEKYHDDDDNIDYCDDLPFPAEHVEG